MGKKLLGIGYLALALSLIWVTGAAAQTEGDPERGGQLFSANCALCHGADGRGRIGADLNQFPGIRINAFLRQTIAQGVDGSVMPAWGEAHGGPLTEQDIADIAAYIEGVFYGTQQVVPFPNPTPAPIPTLAGVSGDPAAGSVIFQQNCQPCHGESGQGRIGARLAKAWSGNIPEARIRVTVRDGVEGSPMPAWGQVNGGPLSDEDIASVTAYVLTLEPVSGAPPVEEPSGPIGLTAGLIILAIAGVLLVAGLIVYYRRA